MVIIFSLGGWYWRTIIVTGRIVYVSYNLGKWLILRNSCVKYKCTVYDVFWSLCRKGGGRLLEGVFPGNVIELLFSTQISEICDCIMSNLATCGAFSYWKPVMFVFVTRRKLLVPKSNCSTLSKLLNAVTIPLICGRSQPKTLSSPRPRIQVPGPFFVFDLFQLICSFPVCICRIYMLANLSCIVFGVIHILQG